jgi:trk system potassium uptake protein TrkH
MQLFQTESSDRSDKFVPRAGELMGLLTASYLGLTTLCALAYHWAGMSGFDALNHAMTTISTGGYSTHDLSLAYFREPAVHWMATIFMFAGSLPLVLYARCVRTRSLAVWRDEQVIGFAKLTAFVVLALTAWYMANTGEAFLDSLRVVSLNAVSIMSTTGYALGDYTLWAAGASGFFFLLMFLNGCTGSTNGGLKMFRVQIMLIVARNYVLRLMSPNRVAVASYNGKQITSDIATAVLAFVSVMFATLMLFTVALSFYDIEFVTALSSVATAITNVGPGLGPQVGPAGNFAALPEGAKLILAFAMILGRLEYFTVLVVLTRDFWR